MNFPEGDWAGSSPFDLETSKCLYVEGLFFNKFINFTYLFLAALGLRFSVRASHCRGFSCCGARALGARALEHRLSSCGSRALERRFSSFGTWA